MQEYPSTSANLELSLLTERINAQTEAYEKFSQALVRILDLLEKSGVMVSHIQSAESDHFLELLRNLLKISENLHNHQIKTKDILDVLKKDLVDLIVKLEQDHIQMHDVMETHSETEETFSERVTLFNNELNKSLDSLHIKIDSLTQMPSQVDSMYKSHTGKRAFAIKIGMYCGAILTIWGFVTMCAGMNWIHIGLGPAN